MLLTIPSRRRRLAVSAVIVGAEPLVPIQQPFKHIGIDATGTDGRDIANPSEVKIYIGANEMAVTPNLYEGVKCVV